MRIRCVLAPVDHGGTSDAALRYASMLARAFGSELHVLHVAPQTSNPLRPDGSVEPAPGVRDDEHFAWLRRAASAIDPRARAVLRRGRVVEQVLGYAADAHANLIVLGKHASVVMSPLLGSIAQRVQLGAACPVLTVPGDRPVPRTILVPTDFSQHSSIALALAGDFGRTFNATVHLLYVMETPRHLAYVPPVLDVTDELWRHARQRLEIEVTRHHDEDVVVQTALRSGEPTAEILLSAEQLRADLIVMGTHGRSALQRLVLGSVAQKIVRRAPCPILTVCASHMAKVEETSNQFEVSGEPDALATAPGSQRPARRLGAASG